MLKAYLLTTGDRDEMGQPTYNINGTVPVLSYEYNTKFIDKGDGQKTEVALVITTTKKLEKDAILKYDDIIYKISMLKKTFSLTKIYLEVVK